MEEVLVKKHGDFRWQRDTAACLANLPEHTSNCQVSDKQSTADQYQVGGEIVGIDCYRVWVVWSYLEIQVGCLQSKRRGASRWVDGEGG